MSATETKYVIHPVCILLVSICGILLFVLSCDNGNPAGSEPKYGTMTDIDGNVYRTVKIGRQEWMAENLRTTRYNDGTPIMHAASDSVWSSASISGTGAYCYYDNTTDTNSIKKFGALYNWYVMTGAQKLAPAGWHVPTRDDWGVLIFFLIDNGYNWDGTTAGNKIAKSLAAKTDWKETTIPGAIGTDLSTNNRSGFSALPGGYREYNGFKFKGFFGFWWSDFLNPEVFNLYSYVEGFSLYPESTTCGFSIRLVKDE